MDSGRGSSSKAALPLRGAGGETLAPSEVAGLKAEVAATMQNASKERKQSLKDAREAKKAPQEQQVAQSQPKEPEMPSRGTKRKIAEGFAARAVLNSMATGASEAAVKGEATPKGKAKAKGKARGPGPKAKHKKAQASEKGAPEAAQGRRIYNI